LWKATKKIKQVKKRSPPLRTSRGTWARSNIENAHAFTAKVFQPHPTKINLKRKKHLRNFSRPLTNSNNQSTVSKELKFKSSTA
jgi:hypothetical protein